MEFKQGFDKLSVLLECSTTSTPTVASLKKYIDLLAAFGYTHFYLGLTDGFKIEGEPYFNFCRGGYTTEQLQEIDAYAQERGVELRANVQVLAHMPFMNRYTCYANLFDTDDTFYVGKPEVYEFVDKILATMSKGIKSRTIHIGMDEAYRIGLGKYLEENGYTERRALLLQHLQRVVELAKKYNYNCEIWSDVFFTLVRGSGFNDNGVIPSDIRDSIPEGVSLVHWTYDKRTDEVLNRHIAMHKAICDNFVFAGSAWKCMGLAPHNEYSMDIIQQQMEVCRQNQVGHYMLTLWSDMGGHCSMYAVLPTLFAAAEIAKGKTLETIDKSRFKDIVGVDFDDFMLVDNLNNPLYHEITIRANRSYWGLLSDIFMGMYDWLLEDHNNDAYAALAERYARVPAAEFKLMFDDYKYYARVLSIKMNIGTRIRKAYHEGRKDLLEKYAREELPQMIAYMKEYINNFEKRWLSENMAFGLEVHHLYYGGLMRRWEYVIARLEEHISDGQPIEEMEREELLPSGMGPDTNEDHVRAWGPTNNLITYCRY